MTYPTRRAALNVADVNTVSPLLVIRSVDPVSGSGQWIRSVDSVSGFGQWIRAVDSGRVQKWNGTAWEGSLNSAVTAQVTINLASTWQSVSLLRKPHGGP